MTKRKLNCASFTVQRAPCPQCPSPSLCVAVQCPKCNAIRWLDDWEVRDDLCIACGHSSGQYAICPANDCVVLSYTPIHPHEYLCRREVEAAMEHETNKGKKRRRHSRSLFEVYSELAEGARPELVEGS